MRMYHKWLLDANTESLKREQFFFIGGFMFWATLIGCVVEGTARIFKRVK